jgi:hypothetical protein
MAIYALIKGNTVANVIMADAEFAKTLESTGEYSYVLPTGGAVIGNLYDPETGEFVDPDPNTDAIEAERKAAAEEAAAALAAEEAPKK